MEEKILNILTNMQGQLNRMEERQDKMEQHMAKMDERQGKMEQHMAKHKKKLRI